MSYAGKLIEAQSRKVLPGGDYSTFPGTTEISCVQIRLFLTRLYLCEDPIGS